jgi:hypothetical protein
MNPDLKGVYVMVRAALRTCSDEEVRRVVDQAINDHHSKGWKWNGLRIPHRRAD